jgi:phosphoenolpyruvate-protein kinase (PTS system EI component)
MTLQQIQRTPWRLVSAAAQWHLTSQQQSRRNALMASTALTERRRELRDVEEFLAEHAAGTHGRSDRVPTQRVAGHSA